MNRLPQRFQSKIQPCPTSGCWIWTGYWNPDGYGHVRYEQKTNLAHRAVFRLLRGAIPEGFDLDHLCAVPACVNPEHLEVVPHRENLARSLSSSAHALRTGFCKRGHAAWVNHTNGGRYCRVCQNERSKGPRMEVR